MSKTQKIGIFGGSFNPVHNGHISLAKNYLRELSLDKLIIIPTNIPPHKTAMNMVSGEHRLNMLKLAFDGVEGVLISDIELKSNEKNYTIVTLKKLMEIYPDAQFFLIVGGDMFLSFDTWKNYEEILSLCTVCAAPRENDELKRLYEYQNKIDFERVCTKVLNADVVDVSSTQVRNAVKDLTTLKKLVPNSVFEYIIHKGLYKND